MEKTLYSFGWAIRRGLGPVYLVKRSIFTIEGGFETAGGRTYHPHAISSGGGGSAGLLPLGYRPRTIDRRLDHRDMGLLVGSQL